MSARGSLTVTLTGAAAKDVAQLRRIKIPDLWHVAHSEHLFPSEADRDAVLVVWRVAHHMKRTLTAISMQVRKRAVPTQRRRKANKQAKRPSQFNKERINRRHEN